jgi:hypothetical protein
MNYQAAFTIDEFCQAHRISRAHFYNLLKSGRGPRLMDVGKKLISAEAAADWRRESESERSTAQVA